LLLKHPSTLTTKRPFENLVIGLSDQGRKRLSEIKQLAVCILDNCFTG